MPLELESAACPACDDARALPLFKAYDFVAGTGYWNLVKCQTCSLVRLDPRPTEEAIAAYYAANPIWAQEVVETPEHERRAQRYRDLRWKFLESVAPRKRILDVGCGDGSMIASLQDHRGWEVYGVDPYPEPVELARTMYGLDVRCATLAEAGFPFRSFEVVSLFNVLEHAHDPYGLLRAVSDVLAPAGVLVIEVPNVDSLQARLFGSYWSLLVPPIHLYHYSPATLARLLQRVGLRITRIIHDSPLHGPVQFSTSLRRALSPNTRALLRCAASSPSPAGQSPSASQGTGPAGQTDLPPRPQPGVKQWLVRRGLPPLEQAWIHMEALLRRGCTMMIAAQRM